PRTQLAIQELELLPASRFRLPNCLLGDNFEEIGDETLIRSRDLVYGAQACWAPSVNLVRLPAGSMLLPGRHFILSCDGTLVEEQIPPTTVLDTEELRRQTAETSFRSITVPDECLLISRYGMMTW